MSPSLPTSGFVVSAGAAGVASSGSFASSRLAPSIQTCSRPAWGCASVARRSRIARPVHRSIVTSAAEPVEVTAGTFDEEVLQADLPVFVDFYSPGCAPCKLCAPLVSWAASEFEGKVKVVQIDTEENSSFVNQFSIRGLPTFAVFKSGEGSAFQEGAMGKKAMGDYIKKHAGL